MKFFQTTLILSLIFLQGCISIPTGDVRAFPRVGSVNAIESNKDKVYIKVSYDSNLNADNDIKLEKRRKLLFDEAESYFSTIGVDVFDVSAMDFIPDNYIDITVIHDAAYDSRLEDGGDLRGLASLACIFSFCLIPAVGNDYDNYVIVRIIENGDVSSDTVYTKSSTQMMSLLFLPLAPFLTQNRGLSMSFNRVLTHSFSVGDNQ